MTEQEGAGKPSQWLHAISRTLDEGPFALKAQTVSREGGSTLTATCSGFVHFAASTATLVGEFTTDEGPQPMPESRMIRGELFQAVGDGSWIHLDPAGLEHSVLAPLFWISGSRDFRALDDRHALATVGKDAVADGFSLDPLFGEKAVLEALVVVEDGLVREIRVPAEENRQGTSFTVTLTPTTQARLPDITRPADDAIV